MNYDDMTLEQLGAALDDLDQQRLNLRQRAFQIKAVRDRKLHDEQLDHWGLTEEQYCAAKAVSLSAARPAHQCLVEAGRAARKAARQTAVAQSVTLGVVAKGP